MPFQPYHKFANRTKLEKLINTLHDSGSITPDAFDNFHRYNPAMIQKLRSAKYNLDALSDKITATSDRLTTTDIQEVSTTKEDLAFELNMFIDGFFYNSGSALDILARIVLTLFGEPLTGKIYFHTAHDRLDRKRLGDTILHKLKNPPWRDMFLNYRNTLTHELILLSTLQITLDLTAAPISPQFACPFPDDPRAKPQKRTYKKNIEGVKYCRTHLRRILSLANMIYGEIATRAETSGTLPL
jgi:hypothetical protein